MTFSAMGKSSEQRTLRLLSNMTSVDINFEGRGRLMEEQQFTAAITFSYLKKKKSLFSVCTATLIGTINGENFNPSFFKRENCDVGILLYKKNKHFGMSNDRKILQVGNSSCIKTPCR